MAAADWTCWNCVRWDLLYLDWIALLLVLSSSWLHPSGGRNEVGNGMEWDTLPRQTKHVGIVIVQRECFQNLHLTLNPVQNTVLTLLLLVKFGS